MQLETLQIRIHGDASLPTLIYLPGLHGDWTLATSLRAAVKGRLRFVEFTYPRTLAWSLTDYAAAVEIELLANGISRGWLLAESFGSQIAWAMAGQPARLSPIGVSQRTETGGTPVVHAHNFDILGLILAGGFVRHPLPWGARLLCALGEKTPMAAYRILLAAYRLYSKVRHRHSAEALAGVEEFIARRTELDRQAMRARLRLIEQNDPRLVARQTRLPVYYLAGLIDPLVPWFLVRCWLRRNCPGYRGGKTCWLADHNALCSAPKVAADTIMQWVTDSVTQPPI